MWSGVYGALLKSFVNLKYKDMLTVRLVEIVYEYAAKNLVILNIL